MSRLVDLDDEFDTDVEEVIRAPRKSREGEARARTSRAETYAPPQAFPVPENTKDWHYRWIAVAVMDQTSLGNLPLRRREGWEFVSPKDQPEIATDLGIDIGRGERIEFRGLVLARIPANKALARIHYHDRQAKDKLEAVDKTYFSDNDRRMPKFSQQRNFTDKRG